MTPIKTKIASRISYFMRCTFANNRILLCLKSIFIVLAVFAWLYFLHHQYEEIKTYEWDIIYSYCAISFLYAIFYVLSLAFGWILILFAFLSDKELNTRFLIHLTSIWLITFIGRYIPGNIWHIAGRTIYARQLKITKLQVVSSSTLEQLLTIIGAAFVSLIALLSWPNPDAFHFSGHITVLIVLVSGIILLNPFFIKKLYAWISKKFSKNAVELKLNYKNILKYAILYSLSFTLSGLSLIYTLKALGADTSNYFLFILGANSLAWLVGYLSFLTPGGLGVREGMLTAFLSIIYSVPIAIIASLLFRLVLTLSEFLGLLVVFVLKRFICPKEIDEEINGG